MAENAGDIYYDVEIKTGNLISEQRDIESAMSKTESQIKSYEKSMNKANNAQSNFSKGTSNASKGSKKLSQNVTQLSFQLQDVAVQAQAGTNALTILGQQGPQITSIFGPAGAIAGVVVALGAAVAGLAPQILGLSSATDKLTGSTRAAREEYSKLLQETQAKKVRAITEQIAYQNDEIDKLKKGISDAIAVQNNQESSAIDVSKAINRQRVLLDQITTRESVINKLTKERLEVEKTRFENRKNILDGVFAENEQVKKQLELYDSVVSRLESQIALIESSGRESAILAAQYALGKESVDDQVRGVATLIERLREARQLEKERLETDRQRKALESQVSGVGLTQDQQLEMTAEKNLELLRQAKEQEILTEEEYAQRRLRVEKNLQDQIASIREQAVQEQLNQTAFLGNTYQDLANAAGSAFGSVLSGAESGSDAVKTLARTILTNAITALVQMGIQSAATQATSAAAAVSAGATMTAAYAPAAASASIASFGAAATTGLAALSAAVPAMISAFSGARQYGGPVNASGMYKVGEGNQPELLKMSNGDTALIPGNRGGTVEPLSMGGTGNITVYNNVTNNTNSSVQTSASRSNDGSVIINTVVNDIAQGGQIKQAMTRYTTASGRTS